MRKPYTERCHSGHPSRGAIERAIQHNQSPRHSRKLAKLYMLRVVLKRCGRIERYFERREERMETMGVML